MLLSTNPASSHFAHRTLSASKRGGRVVAADLLIGDRIRLYRGGRRQGAVAGLVGISPGYLSQIERGLKVPSPPILRSPVQ
ncbi:helix-turn-helix domain-containing protein [Streptomyces griseoviridis]